MILAEHQPRQPSSDESTNLEEVCLSNNIALWQSNNKDSNSSSNDTIVEETAIVHQQSDNNQQVAEVDDNDNDDDDDDEDSFSYSSSDDDDENDKKNNWVAKRLPELQQSSVNNHISGSSKVNISNTSKNVYEGNVVIHQHFCNNLTSHTGYPDSIEAVPTEKITIDKDTVEAVGPKLSNVSSHPLYPFKHDKVTSWCTKKRLTIVSGAVVAAIVIISLAVYFAKKGVPYVERRQWIAQPPLEPPNPLKINPPTYVIISHTATADCQSRGECIYHVRFIQNFHIESRGWDDIGYNFLVGGDGAIYEGRGWDVEGAHTFNYNVKSIGISFIGTFSRINPTEQQIYAARKLIEYASQNGKLDKNYKLLGHRQCIATESPGEKLYNIIKGWPHWSPTP